MLPSQAARPVSPVGFTSSTSTSGPKISAEPRALDQIPGGEANHEREDDHPAAVDRQVHEPEVHSALQFIGDRIGQSGGAEEVLKNPLQDQSETECQKQPVEMIEAGDPLQH